MQQRMVWKTQSQEWQWPKQTFWRSDARWPVLIIVTIAVIVVIIIISIVVIIAVNIVIIAVIEVIIVIIAVIVDIVIITLINITIDIVIIISVNCKDHHQQIGTIEDCLISIRRRREDNLSYTM